MKIGSARAALMRAFAHPTTALQEDKMTNKWPIEDGSPLFHRIPSKATSVSPLRLRRFSMK